MTTTSITTCPAARPGERCTADRRTHAEALTTLRAATDRHRPDEPGQCRYCLTAWPCSRWQDIEAVFVAFEACPRSPGHHSPTADVTDALRDGHSAAA